MSEKDPMNVTVVKAIEAWIAICLLLGIGTITICILFGIANGIYWVVTAPLSPFGLMWIAIFALNTLAWHRELWIGAKMLWKRIRR